jgi:2-methylcitrate dehydratase
LKSYKIDHVVHGAIASICAYGALMGATPEIIESAIGMFVAHYIPFRAIRAGKQLSDSKGASAAISTEAAILCIQRSMSGFVGPKDIFRNPEAIFRLNEKTKGDSPFDIHLSTQGGEFAVMGMHFKLGLYEHQSAGAIEAILKLLQENGQALSKVDDIQSIKIVSYEPAFSIIGDPEKRNPKTRQSADHSMVYIIATLLNKAFNLNHSALNLRSLNEYWINLMLTPRDYSHQALFNPETRKLMEKISFEHGGREYDEKYPDGIPTSVELVGKDGKKYNSPFIMYPSGHARNNECDLKRILENKFKVLGGLALADSDLNLMLERLQNLESLTNNDLQLLYSTQIKYSSVSIDDPNYQ